MKPNFLVAGIFYIPLYLVISTTHAAGTVVQRSQCNRGFCRSNLMRRDDIDGQPDTHMDTNLSFAAESEPSATMTLVDTEEASSEFSQYTITSYDDTSLNNITPTPVVTTLWDENGNAFLFTSTSPTEYGSPMLSTPTPFTTLDEDGNSMVITPTPSVSTLWDENGNVVIYTPTVEMPNSEPSIIPSTEDTFSTDQVVENAENSSPVPVTEKTSDISAGNLETNNERPAATSTNGQNMPVIIGGSVGALALVVGIGGFVGYRAVRNRRKSQWFKSEFTGDTKGFSNLKEVAEIAAHSPGMNTPMPVKNQVNLPTQLPSIPHPSPISTFMPPSIPPLVKRNSTYSSLFVPHFAQPSRTSTQSSVGIRESALEETIIVGFSDYDGGARRKDSTSYRLSINSSVSSNQESAVPEESLFVMTALLPYMPQRLNEMLVQSGDEIIITEEVGEEWLGGYNKSRDPDTKGYFPRTCVTGSSYL